MTFMLCTIIDNAMKTKKKKKKKKKNMLIEHGFLSSNLKAFYIYAILEVP